MTDTETAADPDDDMPKSVWFVLLRRAVGLAFGGVAAIGTSSVVFACSALLLKNSKDMLAAASVIPLIPVMIWGYDLRKVDKALGFSFLISSVPVAVIGAGRIAALDWWATYLQ